MRDKSDISVMRYEHQVKHSCHLQSQKVVKLIFLYLPLLSVFLGGLGGERSVQILQLLPEPTGQANATLWPDDQHQMLEWSTARMTTTTFLYWDDNNWTGNELLPPRQIFTSTHGQKENYGVVTHSLTAQTTDCVGRISDREDWMIWMKSDYLSRMFMHCQKVSVVIYAQRSNLPPQETTRPHPWSWGLEQKGKTK